MCRGPWRRALLGAVGRGELLNGGWWVVGGGEGGWGGLRG